MTEERRTCRKCHAELDIEFFVVDKNYYGGRRYICLDCHRKYRRSRELTEKERQGNRERSRKYHDKPENKERVRDNAYRLKYGLSLTEVMALREKQSNSCAICKIPLVRFHVDHDHASGIVRGLLCHGCNIGLGQFRENPVALRSAAIYIENFTSLREKK